MKMELNFMKLDSRFLFDLHTNGRHGNVSTKIIAQF